MEEENYKLSKQGFSQGPIFPWQTERTKEFFFIPGMNDENKSTEHKLSRLLIQGDPFFVGFSVKHKGISSENGKYDEIYAALTMIIDLWITSTLKIQPNVRNKYEPANMQIVSQFTTRLACVFTPLDWLVAYIVLLNIQTSYLDFPSGWLNSFVILPT